MRFGEIFIDEAKRSKLSLEEYELRTMSPSSVLNSAKNPNTETPAGLMILSLLDGTVKDYINWYVSTQMSASCGDTSGFLDRMTSRLTDVKRGKLETVKTNTFLNQIIFNMISATKRWYCRCTLDVHSFFIECVNRKAVVYQSYFGKYPLSHSIKNLTEWNRKEFIPLLEAAAVRFGMSARACGRCLRVARTIADMAASEKIEAEHLMEAINYRKLDRHSI